MRWSLTRFASRLALCLIIGATLFTATTAVRAVSPLEPPKGLSSPPQATPMPVFELPGIDGSRMRSTDLRGKVTVIRFWVSW